MPPALVVAGVAATAFVSTNVDAFLVLVTSSARAPRSRGAAAAGFIASTALILAASWLLASVSRMIPPARSGLLGVVPLAMGLRELARLIRRRPGLAPPARASLPPPGSSRPPEDAVRFGESLVLHLSLSADNLAVYAALLGDTLPALRPVVAATTLAFGAGWAALARAALRVPGLSPLLMRQGQAIMAALLIGLGVYILVDTDTDVVPLHAHHAVPAASGSG